MDPIRLLDGDAAGGGARPPPARRRHAGRARPHDERHDVRRPAAADRRRRRLHRHRRRRAARRRVWYDAPPSLALHLVDDDRPRDHPLAGPCPALSSLGPVLLAFDTATPYVTVALHDGDGRRRRAAVGGADEARRAARAADRGGAGRRRRRPAGPHRDRGRRRARARSPGSASGWSPPARWPSCSSIPVYGVCSLDVLALEAALGADAGRQRLRRGHRRAPQGGLPRVVRRPRGAGSTGPTCVRPADAATDAPGGRRGCGALPRGLPRRRAGRGCPAPAGWPAPSPRSWPSCTTPSRSTCAAPTRSPPARRRGSRDPAGRPRDDGAGDRGPGARRARLRRLVRRRWSPRASPAGSRPRSTSWRRRRDDARRRLRRGQHRRRRRRAAADRGGADPPAYAASRPALLAAGRARGARPGTPTGCCSRCARTTRVACAFYAARGFAEIDRRPRYYADGTTAVSWSRSCAHDRRAAGPRHRDVVRRDRRRDRPRPHAARRRRREQRRRARALRRRRTRGRQPRPPRGDGADARAGLRDRRHPRCTTSTRSP